MCTLELAKIFFFVIVVGDDVLDAVFSSVLIFLSHTRSVLTSQSLFLLLKSQPNMLFAYYIWWAGKEQASNIKCFQFIIVDFSTLILLPFRFIYLCECEWYKDMYVCALFPFHRSSNMR